MNTRFGVNVCSGPQGYLNNALIFADLMLTSSPFYSLEPANARPDGYPLSVEDSSSSKPFATVAVMAPLKPGNYTLSADGVGTIWLNCPPGTFKDDGGQWNKVINFDGSGKSQVLTLLKDWSDGSHNQIQMIIRSSQKDNPLRNMKLILPGHVGKTFNTDYLNSIQPFWCLRFMDWCSGNTYNIVNWTDRNSKNGFCLNLRPMIDYEYMFQLCNATQKPCWLNIPTAANDDYIKNFAALADKMLDPDLPIYVEYSNETWNMGMPQHQYFVEEDKDSGTNLGYLKFSYKKMGHAINLFKNNLNPKRRCVRVLATQAAWSGPLNDAIAQFKADGNGFDAIAAAPYFETDANLDDMIKLYDTDPKTAITKVLQASHASIQRVLDWIPPQKAIADSLGVDYLLYECGQGYCYWQNSNSAPLLNNANRDPRMVNLYNKYIAGINKAGVRLANFYTDYGNYTIWGSWGHKEYVGQPSGSAQKWSAIMAATRKSIGV